MANQLRIIGGRWRGRRLRFPDAVGLRPTPDRVRETIFNWLMHDTHDAVCLDAFAGSGALGLEALSRGAAHVIFLEQQAQVAQTINRMLQEMECTGSKVISTDTCKWLNQPATQAFDIIFLDPPFRKNLLQNSLALLITRHWLKPNGLVYVECESEQSLSEACGSCWKILKDKQAGEVRYGLIQLCC